MKKYFLFLTLIIIIISGCTNIPGGQLNDVLTGSPNGISIKFLPEQPSSEIFEGSDVNIGLQLTNNAACNTKGKICVTDSAPNSRGGIIDPLCKDFDLLGGAIESGKQRISNDQFYIKIPSYTSLDRAEGLGVTLEATATYGCKIRGGPQLCIKSNLGEDKTCSSVETITGKQLKAPVGPVTITKVVKKFSPESGGVRLFTEITLSKMSNGYISSESSIQNPLDLSNEEPINVYVDFEGNQMSCEGRDFKDSKLYWKTTDLNDKVLRCNTLVNVVEKLQGYLNINLDYTYKITESKGIKITKLTQNT